MSYDDGGRPGSWPPHDPTANPDPPPPAAPVPYGQPSSPPPPPEGAPPPPPPPDAPAQWVPPPPGGPALPMPVVQVSPPQWRPLSGLASALTVLFTLDALAGLFAVGSIANRLNVINDFENGNFGLDIAKRAQDADDLAKAAAAILRTPRSRDRGRVHHLDVAGGQEQRGARTDEPPVRTGLVDRRLVHPDRELRHSDPDHAGPLARQ